MNTFLILKDGFAANVNYDDNCVNQNEYTCNATLKLNSNRNKDWDEFFRPLI